MATTPGHRQAGGCRPDAELQSVVADLLTHNTGGRGADSAIEALGLQSTFEQALRDLFAHPRDGVL